MTPQMMSIRTILLAIVSTLTLLIVLLAGQQVFMQWRQLTQVQLLGRAGPMSDQLFAATEQLALERDIAITLLRTPETEDIKALRLRLNENRTQTDNAMRSTLHTLRQFDFVEFSSLQQTMRVRLANIDALRLEIDAQVIRPLHARDRKLEERWRETTEALIQQTQNLWVDFVRHFTNIHPVVTQHLRYKHLLRVIADYTGRERAVIGRMIANNTDPTPEELDTLLHGQGVIDLGWSLSLLLADQSGFYPSIATYYKEAKSHYQNLYDMVRSILYRPSNEQRSSYPISADLWLELSAQASESLHALRAASVKETQRYIESLEADARRMIALHTVFLLLAFAVCLYSLRLITQRVIKPINAMVEALVDAMNGKPVAIRPAPDRHDEIGKLASVLSAFQENVEEVRSYAQALERSNKELDDFAYIASHDLKEPLRGIHNHSRFLLEDNADKLDPDSVSKLDRLVYLSQRMERLVNDLLYFSRLGRQELAIQPTDLNEAIHDVESTLDLFLEERKARIHIPTPLPTIVCDKPRVTELFRNLITNAVKYNDAPEKVVEIGFQPTFVSSHKEALQNVLYVRDNGRGIAAEFHEEIFRIFKRLQSADKNEEGTGVGLTFVKKIVERHGGHICLESAPGQGTTFYFTLKENAYDTAAAA